MKNKKIIKELFEYFIIIVVVIVIRTYFVTPIKVQQKSMYPTLKENDIMILNKIGVHINGINRFEIVVIKYEDDFLIKRVIGLPGEMIEYKENKLYIDGKEYKEDFIDVNTKDYILEKKIPKDKYFLVGDNRNNSIDSRVFGLVDKKDIIGKTNIIIFPFKRIGDIN